ncbi:fumarylacetoacetase [Sphingomonas populi]|uniref:fumarylacetoacetase n=1 Tax=Sphingomonas populi TaxID=2484750 RepID=A0A4Q6XMA7_9SPHN|nr:fumarylacetoacetase [Sphingomonas populi]RZF60665.1 fumarylacetoacetase [Sphingomonas populi]
MSLRIDQTHLPELRSWVPSADGHPEFPIQNLPLCIFSIGEGAPRGGVVIGDRLLDLAALLASGLLSSSDAELIGHAAGLELNPFIGLSADRRRQFRTIISGLLAAGSEAAARTDALLVPTATARFHMPASVGDYSDFFAGICHATNAGRFFRPDNPLLPNYKHVPIAYHGRSSSIRVSGEDVIHPHGQRAAHGSTEPTFGPSRRVDFELELGMWARGGNRLGQPIPISEAGDHLAGISLLNDWSARDIQAWETQPLGPFLGKNFLTTVSPFIVTAEALAPFRREQASRAEGDPQPLPYLLDPSDQASGALDVHLDVFISTAAMRASGLAPCRLTQASTRDLYWTPAQMIAHHSSNGCDLRAGDLLGTGTISSPNSDGHGSLLEMTGGGRNEITLPSGEQRLFLEDGDDIIFTGYCEAEGFARIGFGTAVGRVVANPYWGENA